MCFYSMAVQLPNTPSPFLFIQQICLLLKLIHRTQKVTLLGRRQAHPLAKLGENSDGTEVQECSRQRDQNLTHTFLDSTSSFLIHPNSYCRHWARYTGYHNERASRSSTSCWLSLGTSYALCLG